MSIKLKKATILALGLTVSVFIILNVGADISIEQPNGYVKVLYNSDDGKIHRIIKDTDWFYFNYEIDKNGKYWILMPNGKPQVPYALTLLEIEKTVEQKIKVIELMKDYRKVDENRSQKYFVKNKQINQIDSWVEYVREFDF